MIESFKIKIAETVILINPYSDKMKEFCKEYLSNDNHEYEISIRLEDINRENDSFLEYYGYTLDDVVMHEQYALLRKVSEILIEDKDTILFHASSLIFNDKAYLFTAKSGTGKTTHAKMWIEKYPDALMINDDKPYLKLKDNEVIVYGNPWNGKEKIGNNISAKLDGILCLYQSDNNQTSDMSYSDKWDFLFKQIYLSKNARSISNTLRIINFLIDNINITALKCNKNQDAVEVAYEALINK